MGQITGNKKEDKPIVDPVVQGTHRDVLTMVTLSEKGNNFVSSLPWGPAGWIIKNTRKLFFFGALHQGPKIAESEETKSKA